MFNKCKLFMLLTLALTLLMMSSTIFAEEQNQVTIEVNGLAYDTYDFSQNVNTPAVIVEGRTLIPLRKMFEIFGVEPTWNNDDRSIEATYEENQIWLQIDNSVARINGVEKQLDVPAQIINNRTYVPLRFIVETFGINPLWDGERRVVNIEVEPVLSEDAGEPVEVE